MPGAGPRRTCLLAGRDDTAWLVAWLVPSPPEGAALSPTAAWRIRLHSALGTDDAQQGRARGGEDWGWGSEPGGLLGDGFPAVPFGSWCEGASCSPCCGQAWSWGSQAGRRRAMGLAAKGWAGGTAETLRACPREAQGPWVPVRALAESKPAARGEHPTHSGPAPNHPEAGPPPPFVTEPRSSGSTSPCSNH